MKSDFFDGLTDRQKKLAKILLVLRLEVLHSMPYREYLQTPEWQSQRHRALKEAGGRCQLCNSDKNPHVHHRTYERRGFEAQGDLTVLCVNCHKNFHGTGE